MLSPSGPQDEDDIGDRARHHWGAMEAERVEQLWACPADGDFDDDGQSAMYDRHRHEISDLLMLSLIHI
eukprot:5845535-Karenia_brevis.AAC.1